MMQKPDNVQTIVYTCCVMHNLLIQERPQEYLATVAEQARPGAPNLDWHDADVLATIRTAGGNHTDKKGRAVREHLAAYYSRQGAVPWQDDAIEKNTRR